MQQIIKSDVDGISTAVARITSGAATVAIPLRQKPPVLNDINGLGYALLKNALFELEPKEIKFAASMCSQHYALTTRQRWMLKRLASQYLGINIDGNSVPVSTIVGEEKSSEPAAPVKRSRGRPRKLAA